MHSVSKHTRPGSHHENLNEDRHIAYSQRRSPNCLLTLVSDNIVFRAYAEADSAEIETPKAYVEREENMERVSLSTVSPTD